MTVCCCVFLDADARNSLEAEIRRRPKLFTIHADTLGYFRDSYQRQIQAGTEAPEYMPSVNGLG